MKKVLPPLLLAISVWLAGCQQIIEIDLPDLPAELVVNCIFTPDSLWQARVTASQGIQVGTEPPAVTNATVLLLENGLVIDTLRHDSADIYVGSPGITPVSGRQYTLQASAPGYAPVSGTDHVPLPVQAHSLLWRDSVSVDPFGGHLGEFSFQIDDPAGAANYYLLSIYAIGFYVDSLDTIEYVYPVTAEIQDPVLEYDAYSGAIRFEDATFDGSTRTIKVLLGSDLRSTSTFLAFSLSSATENYYRYGQSMSDYLETSFNPFAEPVRIHSNMTPGMGIFAGFSTIIGLVP